MQLGNSMGLGLVASPSLGLLPPTTWLRCIGFVRPSCYDKKRATATDVAIISLSKSLSSSASASAAKPLCHLTANVAMNSSKLKHWSTRNLLTRFSIDSAIADLGCSGLTMAAAYAFVSFFDLLVLKRVLDPGLNRKLLHISTGLLFMMTWPAFSASAEARYFAALVPFANFVRLLVYGLSVASNEAFVNAVSRQGKAEELLKGPMYYVLVLISCTTLFWRESPIGIISIAMMSAGDGIADIMGRKFGRHKLPYNHQKSWVGSISMFLFGFLVSLGILYYFSKFGYFELEWRRTITNVAIIATAATISESLPFSETADDNILVPVTCATLGLLLF